MTEQEKYNKLKQAQDELQAMDVRLHETNDFEGTGIHPAIYQLIRLMGENLYTLRNAMDDGGLDDAR